MKKTFRKVSNRIHKFFKFKKENTIAIEQDNLSINNIVSEFILNETNLDLTQIVLRRSSETNSLQREQRNEVDLDTLTNRNVNEDVTLFSRAQVKENPHICEALTDVDLSSKANSLLIPEVNIKSDTFESCDCPVCLEVMENTYKTTCDHIFCSKCIIKMFKNKSNIFCPLCRTKLLESNDITKILRPVYDIPENPDFSFISDGCERNSLLKAYNTITRMNMWSFLKNYDPNPELGFMFDENNEINNIKDQIDIDNDNFHSGISLALTMRHMNYISKHGFILYKESLGVYE